MARASGGVHSWSGCAAGFLCLVAYIAWSWTGGASPLTLIQLVGLGPQRFRPEDLESRSVEELKAMREDLWRALKDIRLPPPTSDYAFGQQYPLPYCVKEPLETPLEKMLGYLAGFFRT